MATLLSATLNAIRHTGSRQQVALAKFDHFFYPEQLFASLIKATSDDRQPTIVSELASRHQPSGSAPATRDNCPHCPHFAPKALVQKLSEATRVVTRTSDELEFESSLQVFNEGAWSTVAAYAYERGQSHRYIYYANGDRQPFFMDLPPTVVLEMAREDFRRNWTVYYREFLNTPNDRSTFPTLH